MTTNKQTPTILDLISKLLHQIDIAHYQHYESGVHHDLKLNIAYMDLKKEFESHTLNGIVPFAKISDEAGSLLAFQMSPESNWKILDGDALIRMFMQDREKAKAYIDNLEYMNREGSEELTYLEYLFISQNFEKLAQANLDARRQLTKNQFNTTLLQIRDQTQHDIQTLVPFVQKFGSAMVERFEKKYGLKFKFLSQLNDKEEETGRPALKLEKS